MVQKWVNQLIERIEKTDARVGVIGLGYVGLPFAVEKGKVGFSVLGFDRNASRVAMINEGSNYIPDVIDEELESLVQKGLLQATTDFTKIAEMDVLVIAVPTPLTINQTPDVQYIEHVTTQISTYLKAGQLVCLESTTYPGTTEDIMQPILERGGLKVEEDFFLAHSPERVDPGNKRYTTKNTNKVVGGVGPNSLQVAMAFYSKTILHMVPVSSAKAAELTKVFENTYRSVNIALVNELTLLCDRMGINVWEVLDAAFTKPFGIQPFYPGPGVGGHCIPLDPHYLEWKAKEYNFNTHFIALAGEINRKMPEYVLDKTYRILNRVGKALSKSKILLLGVAYKKDIDDPRESPSMVIAELLRDAGAILSYHDPYIPSLKEEGFDMESVDLSPTVVNAVDLVVIATDHSNVDYQMVVNHAPIVFDTRNITKDIQENRDRIVLL
jgi:UDP-N-acetyl-D-glucosamine dehydrogenase